MPGPVHQISSDAASGALSPVQASIVAALSEGRTITAAAADLGLHRATIQQWLRSSPAFRDAVEQAHKQHVRFVEDRLQELFISSFDALRRLVEDPATPHEVRLKTALAVLKQSERHAPVWRLPLGVLPPAELAMLRDLGSAASSVRARRR